MIKRIAAIALLFFAAQPASSGAESTGAGFSISPGFSFLYGSIHEYVYQGDTRISRLDWDIKPLLLAGLSFRGEYAGIRAGGGFFFAFNGNTGHIRDYDWDASTGVQTHFSKHRARQRGCLFADLNSSYDIHPTENLSILPGLGLKYMSLQLTAEDGYIEYPPGSPPVSMFGKGIIYEQTYTIPYALIGTEYRMERLDISISLAYSPLAMCDARDSHLKTNIDYYDTIRYARYFMLGVGASYHISHHIAFSLSLTGFHIPETRGDSYYINTVTGARSPTFTNGSGIKTSYAAFTFSADIGIF